MRKNQPRDWHGRWKRPWWQFSDRGIALIFIAGWVIMIGTCLFLSCHQPLKYSCPISSTPASN